MNSRSAERSPSAHTRYRLIAATQASIREVGLPGTTAREIVGRASANLAAIPYHFGTKDALIAAALIADARAVIDPVLELLASDQPPADRALTAAALLNDRFDLERERIPVLLAAIARAPHSPEVASGLTALWTELRTRLTVEVAVLRDAGAVPAWIDPAAMAALILAVVNGVVVGSVVDPDGPSHHDIATQFIGLLIAVSTAPGEER